MSAAFKTEKLFMTFFITTLGCKVNQYESEYMRELMLRGGYTETGDFSTADINIINSCTVTAVADAKNRKTVNRIRRENPSTVIILTGCMPQTVSFDKDSIYDKCDIVLGNTKRGDILKILEEYNLSHIKTVNVREHLKNEQFESMSISNFEERTRAFVKIEDGCNQFCTYCTIPYARGRVRSKPLEELKHEIEDLAKKGYKEIVLVGINLSCYGTDISCDLYDAVKTVCSISGIKRVRLGSMEPENLTEDLIIKLSKEEKFCEQFHLSLQSGCLKTLKSMRRKYSPEEYMNILDNIRKYFKNPGITTDIMVGFAGESDEDFSESLEFASRCRFAKIHIFPYSRREGTLAYSYPDQVDSETKKKRCRRLEEVEFQSRNSFLNDQLGLTESVLFETSHGEGIYTGYTKNYTPVKVYSDSELTGRIADVMLKKIESGYCIGELCAEK